MSFSAVSADDEIEVADLAGNRRFGQSQHGFGRTAVLSLALASERCEAMRTAVQ